MNITDECNVREVDGGVGEDDISERLTLGDKLALSRYAGSGGESDCGREWIIVDGIKLYPRDEVPDDFGNKLAAVIWKYLDVCSGEPERREYEHLFRALKACGRKKKAVAVALMRLIEVNAVSISMKEIGQTFSARRVDTTYENLRQVVGNFTAHVHRELRFYDFGATIEDFCANFSFSGRDYTEDEIKQSLMLLAKHNRIDFVSFEGDNRIAVSAK